MQQYNNVPLDGRAMEIRMIDGSPNIASRIGQRQSTSVGRMNGGGGGGRGNRGYRGRRGRGGRGGGREKKENMSAEQLDKQLDAYISKMDTE